MPVISLPYGKEQVSLEIPDSLLSEIIMPPVSSPSGDPHSIVMDALTHPVGDFSWNNVIHSGRVAIAINDKTRPVPNSIMIPPILDKLSALGFKPEQITFFIATGTHTPMRKEEFPLLLPPEVIANNRIVSHDCDDVNNLHYLGETNRHVPVWINSAFYHSDIKILVGNIEPHHFMGYSGGAKTAAIGLTGRSTINKNHAMLVEPTSTFGVYDENSTRQDVEEIGDMIKIDAALNVVMNPAKQIMHALFGSPREVMAAGIPLSRSICQTKVKHGNFDLVIASPGGYPKDINLYQSQKGLSHAASITRDGGCVILAAQCIEGVGSNSYESFMEGVTSTEEVFGKLKEEGFKVGPHKALQFAREQKRIKIIVVSSIDEKRLQRLLLEPAANLDEAFRKALSYLPPSPSIAVLSKATNTIPLV
jgi:lactate racemase